MRHHENLVRELTDISRPRAAGESQHLFQGRQPHVNWMRIAVAEPG